MSATMKCTQRLYLNADKSKVLPEGHKNAAFLYATPGDEIPASAVQQFGLADGGIPDKALKAIEKGAAAAKAEAEATAKAEADAAAKAEAEVTAKAEAEATAKAGGQ